MKVAIITDTHFGARSDSQVFLDFFNTFYEETFFPTLKEREIDTVLMLGDTFDRRKYTNHHTLMESKRIYFDRLLMAGIQCHMIIGNHDVAFRNSNEVNSPSLLLGEYSNLHIITEPTDLILDGSTIAMIPWINSENQLSTYQFMEDTKADICMGHLEVEGFAMYQGLPMSKGLSTKTFQKFSKVFSGHYHHRSDNGHIFYLGNPYEITWNDYNDQRGFHIYDTTTHDLEFIKNPNRIFYRLTYDEKSGIIDPISTDLVGKSVKLVVVSKVDHYKFDQYFTRLAELGCLDLKVVDDLTDFKISTPDDDIDIDDIHGFIASYIDNSQMNNPEKLKSEMNRLYVEALNAEVA